MARRSSRRRTSKRPIRNTYPIERERFLTPNEQHKGCTSDSPEWQWLAMDVCAHWRDAPGGDRKISTSEDVVAICREFAQKYMLLQEFFGVLCLNQRHQALGFAVVSVGGIASAAVDLRVVLKLPLLANAPAFIVVHNHPSGSADPSAEDVELTRRLKIGAEAIGLKLLDHIVVAEGRNGFEWFSLADKGLMR